MQLNINWKIEKRKVSELKEWPENPRTITKEAFEQLKHKIVKNGFHDVLALDTNDVILSGNRRKEALTELGIEEVFCIIPERELTEQERAEVALESNISEGQWDWSILANMPQDWLRMVGFTEEEMKVNFGISDAERTMVDPDRMEVITVEMPEAPVLKNRVSFYCRSIEEFERIKSAFCETDNKGDVDKLLGLI